MENEALDKLASLPGMLDIKRQVEQIIQFNRISKLREKQGLKALPQSNHMLFTGNPGTGKTTAARLVGQAFASLGILKSDESKKMPFVEIHHADVTSEFVGDAEKKIKTKFNQAKGGVVFIDEAYAFIGGESSHKEGEKVIAAIVQMMEDMRDEVMVIAAGYSHEMDTFLDSNPGLRSRFTNTVHFPDYSVPDMVLIAHTMFTERDYHPSNGYMDLLANYLWSEKDKKGFGNARTVRNIVEQSIRLHSVRIAKLPHPSREDLTILTEVDIQTEQQQMISEKEMLKKAMKDIQCRLFELDLRDIVSQIPKLR
ncbi:AAA family ATPase [Heyndrickxia sporothermodurans]|uniref:AAA family ATPase n=1 Tax=Heyndrickxia sporothermodurans TaxID=46224 RepID=UPI0035DA5253